jgi:putative endonuclease
MREYYTYILTNERDDKLYVGMAESLTARVFRHKGKRASEFTARYNVRKLVYYEKHKSIEDALKRERQLKTWNRQWKIRLIESRNPDWKDLFSEVIKITKTSA